MIRGANKERFGVIPLPVESNDFVAEGELLVSRTTGHIYIRTGGKDISKTVELEEWINNYRPGSTNILRSSGEFIKKFTDIDWNYWIGNSSNLVPIKSDSDGLQYLELNLTSPNCAIHNKIGNYCKYKFIKDKKYTFSIELDASVNCKLSIFLPNDSNKIGDINITPGKKKYELTYTCPNTFSTSVEGSGKLLKITNSVACLIKLYNCQLEEGIKSSQWRKSWYDLEQIIADFNDEFNKHNHDDRYVRIPTYNADKAQIISYIDQLFDKNVQIKSVTLPSDTASYNLTSSQINLTNDEFIVFQNGELLTEKDYSLTGTTINKINDPDYPKWVAGTNLCFVVFVNIKTQKRAIMNMLVDNSDMCTAYEQRLLKLEEKVNTITGGK